MEQKNAFLMLINEIGTTSVALLIVVGLLFGRAGEKETFFLVFHHKVDKVGKGLLGVEHFAFAVLYVVLQVKG